MRDKKEIVKLIYDELKKEDVKLTLSFSKELEEEKTDKLHFIKTTLLNSMGQELGKLLIELEALMELWKKGKRGERLIVISTLDKVSKKDYENSKQFVLILDDFSDWEICDQLALRVVVILVFRIGKRYSLWCMNEQNQKISG